MDELHVSIESFLLAEVLVARRKAGAEEVGLCVVVRLFVLFQALGCMEALVAVRPVADIISDVVMFGFDVVLQVTFTKEGLVAALLRTSKGSMIGVRAFVFLKADRTGIGLGATFKVAGVLVLARSGLGFD